MIRKRLSVQLALLMLLVALVPLGGAGFLTLKLLERSITDQVRASHEQLASAAGALVLDYLKDGTTKLKSISHMIRKDEDPREQTRRLNTLLDPPGIFLEVGYWTVGPQVDLQANVQQQDYAAAQTLVPQQNRAYNSRVKQQVPSWSNTAPIIVEASKGNSYVGETIDRVGNFDGLPISVPAAGGAVLTATLDFKPVSQIFRSLAGAHRVLVLRDTKWRVLACSSDSPPSKASFSEIWHGTRLEHGDWWVFVHEPQDVALAPLQAANRQAMLWFVVAVVIAVGLAFTFSARVVLPLRSLAMKADALGKGNFHVRSDIDRRDEIGQLAQAFDRMASAVQQLDQMKSDFVSHVSHELRTPLTSAKMTLANVQEGIGDKESLARVQQDMDRLIRMVNELLDVARIEAGVELAKQPADLGALVRSAVESLRPLARVALEVSGTGETVAVDAARVQQIVLNLVDNALKYAKSRVTVEVRGRDVRVTDDGPGVPPEHRERIFEKFSKVESGPKPPGAGLGLSIARKLAQLHGGSLTCEGNTFLLKL